MARPDRLPDEERLSRSISGAGVDSGDRRAAARPPCPRSRAAPDVKGPVSLGPTPATSATTWLTEPRPTSITTPMTKPDTPRKQPDGAGKYRIRYFSPRSEVALCGHATIAAAVAADATARGCCVSTLAPARSPSGPAHARQG
jgi:Phenazine biosynthesis-like protein